MNGKKLTKRQTQVLMFCHRFFEENDQFPAYKNIASYFGWSSANAAMQILEKLESAGYLARNVNGKYKRGLRKLEAKE